MPVPECGRNQTRRSLEKLADVIGKQRNPTGNCAMGESTFQVMCSFEYTRRSRRGNRKTLHANFSVTFEPCCPQMTAWLAIRESSTSAAPVVLSETFNKTSSASVSDSHSGSNLKATVDVTIKKEKKTIRFMVS